MKRPRAPLLPGPCSSFQDLEEIPVEGLRQVTHLSVDDPYGRGTPRAVEVEGPLECHEGAGGIERGSPSRVKRCPVVAEMSPLELDASATVGATIGGELHYVVEVLRVGAKLCAVKPLTGVDSADHLATISGVQSAMPVI